MFLDGFIEWTVVTFTKMETWKPDVEVNVQELYVGHVQLAMSAYHQTGKASTQAVTVSQVAKNPFANISSKIGITHFTTPGSPEAS